MSFSVVQCCNTVVQCCKITVVYTVATLSQHWKVQLEIGPESSPQAMFYTFPIFMIIEADDQALPVVTITYQSKQKCFITTHIACKCIAYVMLSRPYREGSPPVKYVCRTKLDLVKSREIVNRIIKVTLDTPEKLNLLKSPPRV